MKRNFTRWKTVISLIIVTALPIALYQNCGKAGFSTAAGPIGPTTSKLDQLKASAPFAFETTFDTISYNSCFGGTLASNPGYFTLRATSQSPTGGVRLRSEFLDYAYRNLHPVYPATTVSDAQVKDLLSGSTLNKEAQPQTSIRRQGDLAVYTRDNGSPTANTDFINLLGSLSDDRWMTDLITKGIPAYQSGVGTGTFNIPYTQYFALGSSSGKNLSATLTWNGQGAGSWPEAEAKAAALRQIFNDDAMLAITYTDASQGTNPRGQANVGDSKAYGTGYRMQFSVEPIPYMAYKLGVINYTPYIYSPANVLSQIQEIDLSSGQPTTSASWSCTEQRRYLIVRPNDRDTVCPQESFAAIANNASYATELNLVRRHYPADQWDVNISLRCMVPKSVDCYVQENDATGNLSAIAYDQREACFQSLAGMPYGSNPPLKLCPQYISICVRD